MNTISARANADLLEANYAAWKEDPRSVEPAWAAFCEGFELGLSQPAKKAERSAAFAPATGAEMVGGLDLATRARIVSMVYNFRAIGHTAAWIDPLSPEPPDQPILQLSELGFTEDHLEEEVNTQFYEGGRRMKLGEMIDRLRRTYCGLIGFEFMHINDAEERNWIRERIEARIDSGKPSLNSKRNALTWIEQAETFERFLHRKYIGQKRFSLEGGEALLVALQATLERCPEQKVVEILVGMAHRGRLNVLANFLHKPLKVILHEFSDNYVPDLVAGDGDVKYHLGFDAVRHPSSDGKVTIHLAANPSHLEAVNAVVEGKTRARQRASAAESGAMDRGSVLPLLIHGDAAFAGQGNIAELLNCSQLPGYKTGGTIHLVINNQIGFTTGPEDARSSRYCTDVAKMIEAPIFHVNGDHPMEVMFAAELALDYRQKFGRDVVIDMVCYRRHGHNEGDEPVFTQPKIYHAIHNHPSVATLFRKELVDGGDLDESEARAIRDRAEERMASQHKELEAGGQIDIIAECEAEVQPEYSHDTIYTGISRERLREIGRKLTAIPDGFQINNKILKRIVEPRRQASENGGPFNWAFGEAAAFGSLLMEGTAVRLSGQDSRRGTFSHRHSVYYDSETRERHIPLLNLSEDQASFCVYNSLLSEFVVLGFDYGYSLMAPDMLIMWEAQFGDFANGAQVIIDQFISSAESKWSQPSRLVMLLPHGYEGQGPEHSSARLERFLQLCAEKNMQVCNLTTPAQFFHVLRRQMKRPIRKPLVMMTPKSLLNHPGAVSTEDDFVEVTHFREMIDDEHQFENPDRVARLIFCSGKVYYDLLDYRTRNEIKNVAIIRIEQLYPFHWDLLHQIVEHYPLANKKWVWCQEEPLNMGAWSYIGPRLDKANGKARVRFAGRDRASSPAAGAKAIHVREQAKLVEKAFSV